VTGTPAGTVVVRGPWPAGPRWRSGHCGSGAISGRAGVVLPAGGDRACGGPAGRGGAGGRVAAGPGPAGELGRRLGGGVIQAVVGAVLGKGRLKPPQRRRVMSYPLAVGLMIAMTLIPGASYCQELAGLLAGISFVLEWHAPAGKAVT
jgi:hypothetical protein